MEGDSAPGVKRHLTVLLAALLLLLLIGPSLEDIRGGRLIPLVAGGVIPVAGIYAVTRGRRHLALALALGLPGVVANLWWLLFGPEGVAIPATVLPLVFFAYVAVVIGRRVFGADRVTNDTLAGAACVYLLLGFTWWFAYVGVELLRIGSFDGAAGLETGGRLDLLYFSFVTLTTLGYGEVTPVGPEARSLAMVEAVAGVLFLAILIARLVGLYRTSAE